MIYVVFQTDFLSRVEILFVRISPGLKSAHNLEIETTSSPHNI